MYIIYIALSLCAVPRMEIIPHPLQRFYENVRPVCGSQCSQQGVGGVIPYGIKMEYLPRCVNAGIGPAAPVYPDRLF